MTWHGALSLPGWESVYQYQNTIMSTHGGSCTLKISPAGLGGGRLSVEVMWSRPGSLSGPPGVLYTSVKAYFPTSGHRTMTGLLLALLHQLDYEVGSGYIQERLPFTE